MTTEKDILRYLQGDSFGYIIPGVHTSIKNEIQQLDRSKFLLVWFDYRNGSLKDENKTNALLLRHRYMTWIAERMNLNLDDLIARKEVYVISYSKVLEEMELKNHKKHRKKKEADSSKVEKYIFHRFVRSFGKRVKFQQPYTIRKRVYYPTVAIKSLRVVVDIGNNISERDFNAIGYRVVRIRSDDVKNRYSVTQIINDIKNNSP